MDTEEPDRAPRHLRGGLFFGALLLVLVIGGLAGAVGGYLAGSNEQPSTQAPTPNSLDAPPPAQHTAAAPAGTVEAAAQHVLPTVVELQSSGGRGGVTGSGVVFSHDGLILTNEHVVTGGGGDPLVAYWQDGRTATVRVVGTDPTSDLAVVRAEGVGEVPAANFGRSDDLRVGQQVVAFGAPFRLAGTVTTGIVSALHRPTRAGGGQGEQATVMDAVQTDAAINPGNSGGPLVALDGTVVAINSAIYSPPTSGLGNGEEPRGNLGLGFAIPIDQAKRIGRDLAEKGTTTQSVLGVSVRDDPRRGAVVIEVTPGGPGQRAGIQTGEVITGVDGRPIDSADALVAAVHAAAPGTTLSLAAGSRTVRATLDGKQVGRR
ncbi:S1C family serine protease [Sciscionella sediminilitoris]|uniref:S1C family serine protease n=1 Tax=Sciscionella sediminilitoris TaxID=1445613 RepID=UPI000689C4F9|nr:trypsin-like peptidase domain-containing protein [Sciscionella sp. SE31]